MTSIKMIFDGVAALLSLLVTIIIFFRNHKNFANILIGIATFCGGFLGAGSSFIRDIFYEQGNTALAIFFGKLSLAAIFSMSIPTLIFSALFWQFKNKATTRVLLFLSPIPALLKITWLFIVDVLTIEQSPIGPILVFDKTFTIVSTVTSFLIYLLFVLELIKMTLNIRHYPQLRTRMILFTLFFSFGVGAGFFTLFLSQFIEIQYIQFSSPFVVISAIITTFVFAFSISKKEEKIWHGCPKLHKEYNGSVFCLNTQSGEGQTVKLLDLGDVIEHVQIEVDILKTGNSNCANTVFCNKEGLICCLTTHEPIKVIGEPVTQDEMQLAKEMMDFNGNGNSAQCSECLHKIIVYRKQHKEKSTNEIKQFFLGMRAEELFGIK